ncbi:MAG: chalcone isomerase family protein [Burkholderiaceae bacterium]|nr:chalcone isomerase family protein [Burkholderiaceae bacterium]
MQRLAHVIRKQRSAVCVAAALACAATTPARAWLATVPAAIVALALMPPVHAAEVEGVDVDDAVELDGARLLLNGAGMRTVYIVKAYVAALYVPSRSPDAKVLLAQQGPRRLSLTMLADLSSEWVTQRFVLAMRDNHDEAELATLGPRIERLIDTMLTLGQTRKGERIDIDFVAGATRVSVDGHPLGPAIPGEALFTAILRIFVGERPIDAELKQAMLGG